jgi:hypothetical protein
MGCGRFDGKNSRAAPGLLAKKGELNDGATPNIDHGSLLTRRSIIGAGASLICMPAIVRVTNLMPVRRIILKSDHYYGLSTDCGLLIAFR